MKTTWIPAIALSALCLLAAPTPAQAMDLKEFKRAFAATQNSWERRALVEQLDPTDKKSRKILYYVLTSPQFDWYMRLGAIEVFEKCTDEGVIKELKKVKPSSKKDALKAEAIAVAFGKSGNVAHAEWLIKALDAKADLVRRAAAINMRFVKDKQIIGALIKAWQNEDQFTVWVHMLESLEKLTYQKGMPNSQDWADWWAVNEDSFDFEKAKAEAEKSNSEESDLIKTKVRGTNLTMRSRGKGLPLLVLPDYGFEQDYLETYLRNLEDTNQILYMRLPGTSDFTDPPLQNAPGAPQPYYPLQRIGDAFEALHAELVKQGKIKGKFAILAHGISCWIAMKFAEKHPRAVRRLILIGAHSGNKAAGEGIKRIITTGQKQGDLEMEHYGQSRQYDGQKYGYQANGAEEKLALNRKSFTIRFGDRRNLEIGRLYGPIQGVPKEGYQGLVPKWVRPMGGCFIPEFSLFKLDKKPVPTMIMIGLGAIESSLEDANAISKFYGRYGKVAVFKRSGEMPFIEENEKFVETTRKWLGGKKKKKKKKKR
jgi:pimeloyl-ACP methyl ester carboxylesterase